VSFECISNLEVGIPNFKSAIPSDTGKVRLESSFGLRFEGRRVSDATNPISMVV